MHGYLDAARAEFRQARRWYRDQSEGATRRFALEVKSAISAIRQSPDLFPRWDKTFRYYLLNRFPFFIAYRYTEEQVTVVAIRHTSRDEGAWTDR
jgi:plasmid stabilization system protein ParE